jgi:hypothetical protein
MIVRRSALILVCVLACGPARSTDHARGPDGAATDGSEGAVCAWGERSDAPRRSTPLASCQPGLSCCYPCGIAGCDSVCATKARCEEWSTLP